MVEKTKSIDHQYWWREERDPLEMVQRGGEAEIQSDIWPNLIFSGTNIEPWRFAGQILNLISNEEHKCLL